MANSEHLAKIKEGVANWNAWSAKNKAQNSNFYADLEHTRLADVNLEGIDLSGALLLDADLSGATLTKANLRKANLINANLSFANLCCADLSGARLETANLHSAKLRKASLRNAHLMLANLSVTDLTEADISKADLTLANLVRSNLKYADLSECLVYGVSAWDVELKGTKQSNLHISYLGYPSITVDYLEVAQFIHLLQYNKKLRHVIDTITSKVILILGRFTEERKEVLEVIREQLRKIGYVPVLFDFEKPASKDLTETVSIMAHMARFIIADITDPRSIPHELATIVPTLSVPIQPLLFEGSTGEYAMFNDLKKYDWVLSVHHYKNLDDLLETFEGKVVFACEEKAKELLAKKQ